MVAELRMPITEVDGHPASRQNMSTLLILLLVLAAAEFAIRGPLRYAHGPASANTWSDITQIYVPSRAWLMGRNPYDPDNFMALYQEATNAVVDRGGFRSHSPHPLTTLVVFSPIASLPWPVARVVWAGVMTVIIFPTILALGSFLGKGSSNNKIKLAVATLALAPLHTGIAVGNVSVVAIAFCAIAFWASQRTKESLAGTFIAFAGCLKPQIGVLFLLYYLLRKRWRIAWVAITVGSAVFVLGIARLEFAGTPWWSDFWRNASLMEHNRLMDSSDSGSIRFTMINLQVVLNGLLPGSRLANVGAILVGMGLWGKWSYSVFRTTAQRSELLMASAFITIGLLPSYHRNYDAFLLIFPLCWALSSEASHHRRSRLLALLAMAPFLVPGPMLLQTLVNKGIVSRTMSESWWWNNLIMAHQTWLILALSLILLHALSAESESGFDMEGAPGAVLVPA
jgi:hypothetical protein